MQMTQRRARRRSPTTQAPPPGRRTSSNSRSKLHAELRIYHSFFYFFSHSICHLLLHFAFGRFILYSCIFSMFFEVLAGTHFFFTFFYTSTMVNLLTLIVSDWEFSFCHHLSLIFHNHSIADNLFSFWTYLLNSSIFFCSKFIHSRFQWSSFTRIFSFFFN